MKNPDELQDNLNINHITPHLMTSMGVYKSFKVRGITPHLMYYVYLLKSSKDGKLYIGSTNNLERRIFEHSEGLVFATKYRLPLKLVYYEAYLNEKNARRREKRLKYFGKAYQELKKRIVEIGEFEDEQKSL